MSKVPIIVKAKPRFLPEQSSPEQHNYVWAYEIIITNETNDIIQLLNRHWRITDANNKVSEIQGPGVIGLQPLIKPGKLFTYESFCQLNTSEGSMEGYYEMQNLDEEIFIVEIPKFSLTSSGIYGQGRLH